MSPDEQGSELASYCRRARDRARQRAAATDNEFVAARLEARADTFEEVLQKTDSSSEVRPDGGTEWLTVADYLVGFVRASKLYDVPTGTRLPYRVSSTTDYSPGNATDRQVREAIQAVEQDGGER